MKEAEAFAPCHITGIFQIFDDSANALEVGSKGAGVSLREGVHTAVKADKAAKGSVQFRINSFASNSLQVSMHVANVFTSRFKEMENFEANVEHNVKVPIGAGFGTSGAAALSLALALNDAFDLGMSRIKAAQLAHIAEVECKTGLGTVIAETFGGVEIRVKPGAPGIGEIKHVSVSKDIVVACLVFGPLSTRKFLTDRKTRQRINEFGGKLIDQLIEEPSIDNFMRLSRQFAEHVGLITERTRKVLIATDEVGFVCSMPMFGESIFTLTERNRLDELLDIFSQYEADAKIVTSEIDFEGARLLQ